MNGKKILFALLAVLIVGLSFFAGLNFCQTLPPDVPEEFDSLWEVWYYLERDYVNTDALDPDELSRGAIDGLLEALGDPYTSYIDAETYEMEQAAFEGSFEGIGAVVTIDDDELTVVSPIAGTPAEQQGIKAGDKILEVNGEPTSGMSLAEAVLKIRGPKGTTVTLLILHKDESTPVEIEIVRAEIELTSVYLDMLPDDIAHLRITYFSDNTPDEVKTALTEALESDAAAIVLDLRGNPGGLLASVVDVASEFLDGGIVLYEAYSDGRERPWSASDGGLATDIPMVVLVDGGSASGSEVLGGAFQDRGRAPLIGTTTYGKGSVNVIEELSDGSALYVTTARWLTPNRILIEGVGLTPAFYIDITEDDIASGDDPQMDFAVDYVKVQ